MMAEATQGNPIAVVDIGSNSVRLVVFDGARRSPVPLFNEKVLCGLGRGLAATGRLHQGGVERALGCLARFAALAGAMKVARFDLFATAAVREAKNGDEFVAEAARQAGAPVAVLSGEEEARLSALGVLSGAPGAEGVSGDLGGGSLELAKLRAGALGEAATLALGPFHLMEHGAADSGAVRGAIDRQLDTVPWLERRQGATIYPVGGAWRTLARIHMEQNAYPLHIIHGYTLSGRAAADLVGLIARTSRRSLARIPGVQKERAETLPYGAAVLQRLIQRLDPREVTFSANGLREGHLFDLLPRAERARDPLIASVEDLAPLYQRFPDLGAALDKWVAPLFSDASPAATRRRRAAAHLADIGWRDHPDHRQADALERVLWLPLGGATHADRIFLARAVLARYTGRDSETDDAPVFRLLDRVALAEAEVLGRAFRLALDLFGGAAGLFSLVRLRREGDELGLDLAPEGEGLMNDNAERAFAALARALKARVRARGRAVLDGGEKAATLSS